MSEIVAGWRIWPSTYEDGRVAAWNAQKRREGWPVFDYAWAPTRDLLLAAIGKRRPGITSS